MNEPVAWMQTLLDGHTGEVKHTLEFIRVGINDIPLYTHPPAQQWTIEAKFKELTDEEILEIAYLRSIFYEHEIIDFARAILRKASEK